MSQIPLSLPNALSQSERLYRLLQDRKPHRTDEIVRVVYSPGQSLARVAARICDLKKQRALNIRGWRDPERPSLYFYQLVPRTDEATGDGRGE